MYKYSNLINEMPEPLNIYRMVLKGDHLHFGYWCEGNVDIDIENAQEEMFRLITSMLPAPPARILDVGCGLGVSASFLAAKGYEVTAIAPSEALIAYCRDRYAEGNIQFIVADFLDPEFMKSEAETFDAILFQESLQYLHPLDLTISKAYRLLRLKGSLVVGDEVCLDPEIREMTSVHMLKDIIVRLSENCFKVKSFNEVGSNVQRTCDIIIERIEAQKENLLSSLEGSDASSRLEKLLSGWKSQKKWYGQEQFGYVCLSAFKDDFMVRAYEDGESFEILSMFNKIFNASRTIDHWRWKFECNPYGAKNIAIARSKTNDLAAHFCAFPVPMYYSKSKVSHAFLTAQAGDTMTSPAFRNIGLGKTGLLARTATYFYSRFCKDKYPFIYGFNTGNIKKLGERYLGYKYIYPVPYVVLDVRNRAVTTSFWSRLFKPVHINYEHKAGREFDIFFESVRDEYCLLVERSSRYLNWRYFNCPDKVHDFYSVRKYGKLLGWAVFLRKNDALIWGDALFSRAGIKYLGIMIDYVLNRYPGIASLEGWFSKNPDWWISHLQKNGFCLSPEPNNLYPCFRFFSKEYTLDHLADNFYFTMGDSDLF